MYNACRETLLSASVILGPDLTGLDLDGLVSLRICKIC